MTPPARGWQLAAFCALLAACFAPGTILHPGWWHVMPPVGDVGIAHWNFWWVGECLSKRANPFFAPGVYYPQGADLAYHTLDLSSAVALLPVRWLSGGNAEHAAALFVATFLTAWATWRAAEELGAGAVGSAAATIAVALHPYRLLEAQHLNIFSTQFEPLVLLCCLRVVRGGSPARWGMALGGCGALAVATSLFHALAAAMLGAAVLLAAVLRGRLTVARLLIVAATTGLVAAPAALGQFALMAHAPAPTAFDTATASLHSNDLWQFILAPFLRIVLTGAELDWTEPGLAPEFRAAAWYWPGYLLGVLAVAAVARRGGRPPLARALLLAGAGFAVLSLGPALKADSPTAINPGPSAIPLPAALLSGLPVLGTIRSYWHFGFVFTMLAAVLGASQVDALLAAARTRLPTVRPRVLAAFVLGLVFLETGTRTIRSVPPAESPEGRLLRDAPGRFCVYAMPTETHLARGFAMYEQTLHGRPLVGGYTSRDPESFAMFLRELRWPDELADVYYGRARRLSPEALRGLATHERLPLPVVVQVNFYGEEPGRGDAVRAALLADPGARMIMEREDVLVVAMPGAGG